MNLRDILTLLLTIIIAPITLIIAVGAFMILAAIISAVSIICAPLLLIVVGFVVFLALDIVVNKK